MRDYAALSGEAREKLNPKNRIGSFGSNFSATRNFDQMLEHAGGNVDTPIETWRKESNADYADTANIESKERAELKLERRAQSCSEWQAKLDSVK